VAGEVLVGEVGSVVGDRVPGASVSGGELVPTASLDEVAEFEVTKGSVSVVGMGVVTVESGPVLANGRQSLRPDQVIIVAATIPPIRSAVSRRIETGLYSSRLCLRHIALTAPVHRGDVSQVSWFVIGPNVYQTPVTKAHSRLLLALANFRRR
jgi:hypothetical protein